MPYIVTGEPTNPQGSKTNFGDYNFDYDYLDGLDLKPGSDLHEKIKNKIWQRARESNNEISKRFSSWREVDDTMNVYIPLKDKEGQLKKKDATKPVSIVIPYSYSVLESMMTYMSMAYFQDPIFRYEGVEDSDTVGAMLMELVVKMHCIKNKVPLSIYSIVKDSLKYGVGIGIPGWSERRGRVPIRSTSTQIGPMGTNTQSQVNYVERLLFEGNDLTGVDPYLWLPDVSVASHKIQDGEFIGWLDRDNYLNMLSEERDNTDGTIFNVKYLKAKKWKRSALTVDNSSREKRFGGPSREARGMTGITNPVDNIKMYINLIPKDWGIGDSEYPEKWFFNLAADEVITEMYRAEHNHGMYPVAVASPEYDGYTITPMGRMELLTGSQTTINFLFNSHIANVRKAINDMFVVDPYLININDLLTPGEGKIIRTRRPAWGHGVKGAVEQLQVNDITRANLSDASYLSSTMDRLFGIDASMSGALRQGGPERLTKGEFQSTRGSSVSRLQQTAMVIGMQFMQDIGTMFAVHTQQNMSQEAYVSITGRHEEQLKKVFGPDAQRARVTPYDLSVATDLIVRDGSIPGGNFSDAWLQMFQTIGSSPLLQQEFDISRIFMYIASELGAKNVEDFKRNVNQVQPQVMPDEQVAQQVQAGNMVPAMGDM